MSDNRWEIEQNDGITYCTIHVTNGVQRHYVGQSGIIVDHLVDSIKESAQKYCDERNAEIDSKLLKNHAFSEPGVSMIREYPRSIVIAPNTHISNSSENCVELTSEDSAAIARHFYNRSNDKEAFISSIKGE